MSFEQAPELLSIGELAERADVSRRTIRFYIQRGLIAPPKGGGRGSHYTEHHLERLLAVKRMQEVGVALDVILHRLGPPDATAPDDAPPDIRPIPPETTPPEVVSPPADTWRRHILVPGVELLVRDDALSPDSLEDLVRTARLIARRDQLDNG